ncbi:fasciclin domain-containing protein [Flavihumibacter petaseus]|uniref:FAS1 domain-containing protein n=1 Tax=Flavihumibacter petaseus NBRC 106054 TaxID=1220578 RepID=A0A0E9N4M2_9BACT|nr:fasciclin domain-containing protein [Flavihumibacter petaseus]GAO44748.1 hypothetical protein FPE01S_03_07880 [Flavihumibacter petaseus NBRC 106054]
MLQIFKKYTHLLLLAALLTSLLPACNEIPEVEDLPKPDTSGITIKKIIETDPNYTLLKAAATKSGLLAYYGNVSSTLTLFAPDDAAFLRSGVNIDVINALPAAQLAAILQYHTLAQTVPGASVPDLPTPNVQLPTLLQPLADQPLFKLSAFPSRRGNAGYVNNIPVTAADQVAVNGVIRPVYAIVAPPQATLKGLIAADTSLSFLRAAITRADEGSEGLAKFDSLLNYPFPNLTLMAPNNNGFRRLLTYMGLPADPAVFAMLPVQTVRGIIAFHFFGTNGAPVYRYFTPNLVSGNYETLIGPAPMPPVVVDMTNPLDPVLNGVVWLAKAHMVRKDVHGVNGVMHVIDQVLLPQPL